jgi:uncharacterized alkaline shock family protein YloU
LTISRKVVKAIIYREASQVPGVVQLGGDSILKKLFRFLGLAPRPRGIELELADGEAAMTLTLVVRYGAAIPELAAELRRRIKTALRVMAGIDVRTVNVYVKSVKAAGHEPLPAPETRDALPEPERKPRRFDLESGSGPRF